VKLNIGAGGTKRPGFVSVDVRPDSGADIISTAWDLAGIADQTVEEIYSRHMLEHLDPDDARRALVKWLNVLKPGGVLNVIVPDLEFHARQLLGTATSSVVSDQESHAFAGFYGWRDVSRGGNKEDTHRWGYTARTLTLELKQAGFGDIARVTIGTDSEPWHLNVRAVRPRR
jgi:hypothetical protein